MRFANAKTDFLEYLEIEQNRSQKTIRNYDHYLTRLADYGGDIDVSDIDQELVRKWRLWLNRLGTNVSDELQKTTLNYHLIALRSFLKFCNKRGMECMSPDKIELSRTKRPQVTFLNEDELVRMFEQPDTSTIAGLRDRAILELLFSSGLRVSELVGQIDLSATHNGCLCILAALHINAVLCHRSESREQRLVSRRHHQHFSKLA